MYCKFSFKVVVEILCYSDFVMLKCVKRPSVKSKFPVICSVCLINLARLLELHLFLKFLIQLCCCHLGISLYLQRTEALHESKHIAHPSMLPSLPYSKCFVQYLFYCRSNLNTWTYHIEGSHHSLTLRFCCSPLPFIILCVSCRCALSLSISLSHFKNVSFSLSDSSGDLHQM